ncbi:MAG: NAD(P)/FAD-dependent oxidoreductase [Deltaproteobacteria bacterium]|nr:NAD(P)/FAD-dependent oxidoreductase [Deltaproteobacteria bacterium]
MAKQRRCDITPEIANTSFDAIVIGSGLSGLTTAVGLARGGKKVLLVERHYLPGGYATSFRRKKFTFEVSLHATSGLGKGGLIHQMLSELGVMDRVTPIPIGETMLVKSPVGDFAMGPGYLEDLKRQFPQEAAGIDALDAMMIRLRKEYGRMHRLDFLPERLYQWIGRLVAPTLYRYRHHTLDKCLADFTNNEDLKRLLAVQFGYFGLPLSKISAVLYLLGWSGFLKEGIFYIKGSSQALSNALVERLEELGGHVLLGHGVEEILVNGGRAVGVRCKRETARGEGPAHEFRAPVIVSNANPFLTFKMLSDGSALAPAYRKQLQDLEVGASLSVLWVGLDCKFSEISKEKSHSLAFFEGDSFDLDRRFESCWRGGATGIDGLTDYSSLDPSLAPEGKSALLVVRQDFMKHWRDLDAEQYQAKKAAMIDDMLGALEARYPGFRSHVEVVEAGTPRTMERYTLNVDGSFNGFAYNTKRVGMGNSGLNMKTPIKGLYLASAWIGSSSGGFYGCIINGFTTAKKLLRVARWTPIAA